MGNDHCLGETEHVSTGIVAGMNAFLGGGVGEARRTNTIMLPASIARKLVADSELFAQRT